MLKHCNISEIFQHFVISAEKKKKVLNSIDAENSGIAPDISKQHSQNTKESENYYLWALGL